VFLIALTATRNFGFNARALEVPVPIEDFYLMVCETKQKLEEHFRDRKKERRKV